MMAWVKLRTGILEEFAAAQAWSLDNPAFIAAWEEWAQRRREADRERTRRYYRCHKKQEAARRLANRDTKVAYLRDWYAANRDRILALKRQAKSSARAAFAHHDCATCGKPCPTAKRGRAQRKFCSDACRARGDYAAQKARRRAASAARKARPS